VDVFPGTADGKVDLCPEVLGAEPYSYRPPEQGPYPLSLISPATSKLITSTLGEFNLPVLWVALHGSDAAARGISNGDRVRVFNELGEVVCEARVTDDVRPGVVSIPKGAWRHSAENGYTSTVLCPDTVNIVAGGACFNDARVEVERLAVGREP
jgi:anaerobic selenocysteine-containing dehydrogenase